MIHWILEIVVWGRHYNGCMGYTWRIDRILGSHPVYFASNRCQYPFNFDTRILVTKLSDNMDFMAMSVTWYRVLWRRRDLIWDRRPTGQRQAQEAVDHLASFPSSREEISQPGFEPPTSSLRFGYPSTITR